MQHQYAPLLLTPNPENEMHKARIATPRILLLKYTWIAQPSPSVQAFDSTGWCMKLNKRDQVFRLKIQNMKHVAVF